MDGPEEFHVVLMDNGRSRMLADGYGESLMCIRCGACLNVCPVYRQISGHSYGNTYSGPIGAVISPLLSEEMALNKELPYASTLCGACRDACPVQIDLPKMLLNLRHDLVSGRNMPGVERRAMQGFAGVASNPAAYRGAARMARTGTRLLSGFGNRNLRRLPPPLHHWTRHRDFPPMAKESFREWWAKRPGTREDLGMSQARQRILDRLRQGLADPKIPWPPADAPPLAPGEHMHVAILREDDAGPRTALRRRNWTSCTAPATLPSRSWQPACSRYRRILAWLDGSGPRRVLAWPDLNSWIPGLEESLSDRDIEVVVPESMTSPDTRADLQGIRVGITGVEAAFAATGSVLLKSAPGKSRTASLLPLNHIALIPGDRLLTNVETWLAHHAEDGSLEHAIRNSANLTLVSGPSKSADIESKLTLGVHGPKELHAVLYPAA